MALKVIPCTKHHVNTIQEIGIKTFKETYEAHNTPTNLSNYLAKAFNKEQLLKELNNPESFFFLVLAGRQAAGYLKINIGSTQTNPQGAKALEIERIYVAHAFQRQGIGKLLLDTAEAKAKELEKETIWLGVYEKNQNAVSFYKYHGYEVFGKHTFQLGNESQSDFLFKKELLKS